MLEQLCEVLFLFRSVGGVRVSGWLLRLVSRVYHEPFVQGLNFALLQHNWPGEVLTHTKYT